MKRNTYPVAVNAQAEAYRKIFDVEYKVDDTTGRINTTNPGRVKGINNSPNLIALFPNSPFIAKNQSVANDRGRLLNQIEQYPLGVGKKNDLGNALVGPLDNETIGLMFKNVIDGYATGSAHVRKQGNAVGDGISSSLNYNWLYRDKPMDMNFKYLDEDGKSNSPNATEAPVGSNAPIPDSSKLNDRPFWGHANLNVPSIDWKDERDSHFTDGKGIPQLKRGTGGFGSSFKISNRAFAAQEQIGQYFTNSYINTDNAGDLGDEEDRLSADRFGGKSIKDRGAISDESADYQGDVDKDGNPRN